jgi:hypothetical protein
MNNYRKLTAVLIGSWFIFSLAASELHLYRIGAGTLPLPLPLGIAVLTPIILFLVWFFSSANFRQFTMSLDPRLLTMVQSWRTGGFVFLVLATYGILPGLFALPAGWGDIVIGATAPMVALKLTNARHRGAFVLWQFLGIADLLTAITLGALAGVIDPHGIPTDAMTVLPMSLIPTFAVPLLAIFHIICIAQSRRLPINRNLSVGRPAI